MNKEEIIKEIHKILQDAIADEVWYQDTGCEEKLDRCLKVAEKELTKLIQAQNKELLKKIEEMKKDNFKEGTFTYAFQDLRNRAMQEGYNQALQDIKKLIK